MLQSTNLHLIKFILKDKEAADKKSQMESTDIFFIIFRKQYCFSIILF